MSKLFISRQAVIVIHGIGEQRPMDTLQGFAEAVAPPNQNPDKPAFFSKPDQFSDSFELRRLTANRQRNTFKTDYFEFYWAHLLQGTELRDITWWIWNMFVRSPSRIPKRLHWIFYAFWGALIITLGLLISIAVKGEDLLPVSWRSFFSIGWFKTTASFLVTIVLMVFNGVLLNYLGDAVRYFTPRPRNVPERQQIRKAGIALLRRLHEARNKDGGNLYDRIIVVGHSLGSVIAYDLLCLFWNEVSPKLDLQPTDIDAAEKAASNFRQNKESLKQYKEAQFEFWKSQYKNEHSWRVSDFITAGSPLAFADLYLADDPAGLEKKERQREFPTCPPRTEPPTAKQQDKLKDKGKTEWFSFPASDNGSRRTLHDAALFSMTRWSNMFFRNDYVGGPITCFDPGVENQEFVSEKNHSFSFQSHTHYWDVQEPKSLSYLRSKMQLTFRSLGFEEDDDMEE